MKRLTLYILCSALLLSAGGMIYVLFREEELLLYTFANHIGLGGVVMQLRGSLPSVHLPLWIANSLPDGLWSASYVLLMHGMMRPLGPRAQLCWASVIPSLGVISELLQGMGLLPGVFDTTDLLCYIIPYAIYYLIIMTNKQTHHGQRIGEIT